MRPKDGLNPTTPQNAAGMRTDPAPSVPIDAVHSPADTAAAEPPLEPPADLSRAQGFRVGPATRLTVLALHPCSDVAVLPTTIAPAARRRATAGASSAARRFGSSDPLLVGRSRVWMRSFTDTVTPSSGRPRKAASPRQATSRSAASASRSAPAPATA